MRDGHSSTPRMFPEVCFVSGELLFAHELYAMRCLVSERPPVYARTARSGLVSGRYGLSLSGSTTGVYCKKPSNIQKQVNCSAEICPTEKRIIPLAEQDATFCDGYRFIGIFRIS